VRRYCTLSYHSQPQWSRPYFSSFLSSHSPSPRVPFASTSSVAFSLHSQRCLPSTEATLPMSKRTTTTPATAIKTNTPPRNSRRTTALLSPLNNGAPATVLPPFYYRADRPCTRATNRKRAALHPPISSICAALGGYEEFLDAKGEVYTAYSLGDQVVGALRFRPSALLARVDLFLLPLPTSRQAV
jgi:hypothetical protein